MLVGAAFLMFLRIPSAAADDSSLRRAYEASRYERSQAGRLYSLPPAIHYIHQDQWLQYKRQHDEEERRESEQARRLNESVRPPVSVYTHAPSATAGSRRSSSTAT